MQKSSQLYCKKLKILDIFVISFWNVFVFIEKRSWTLFKFELESLDAL